MSEGEPVAVNPPADEPAEEPVEAPGSPQEPPEEVETPETPEEGPESPTEAPEPPQEEPESVLQPGTRAFDKAARSLERSVETYKAAVARFAEATGQALILNEASLEWAPGYNFHPQVQPLTDEQAQFARLLLGEAPEPKFEQDPQARECPTCLGWGHVKTGSKVANEAVRFCTTCQGRGWVGPRAEQDTGTSTLPAGGEAGAGDVKIGVLRCPTCRMEFSDLGALSQHITSGACTRPADPFAANSTEPQTAAV